tara:strand:+ start:1000 stop:2613 length:1614 start_codon:yes stop_codon:yes gene_type:complete
MLAFGITSFITAQTCNDLSSSINEGFESGVGSFTVVDNNGGTSWGLHTTSSHSGANCLRYAYDNSLPGDDIAFSECLDLQIGETYNVSFYVRAYNTTGEKMRVILSNDTTFSSIIDTLLDYDPVPYSSWTMVSHNFTVTAAGNYHIGFQAYSAPYEWWLYLDDISISKVVAAEAGLVSVNSSGVTACGGLDSAETVTVEFINNGTDSISTIDLHLDVNGNSTTETYSPSTPVGTGDTATYTFGTTVDMSNSGVYTLNVSLALNGDNDASNDSLSMEVKNIAPLDLSSNALTMGFETNDDLSGWNVIDNNSDGDTWGLMDSSVSWRGALLPYSGNRVLHYSYSFANDADDWIVSSCIDMQAGKQYVVSFAVAPYVSTYSGSAYTNEKVMLAVGNDNMPSAMTDTLINLESLDTTWTVHSDTFSVASSGVYYLGIQAYSDANEWGISVDDINLSELTVVSTNDKLTNNINIYPNPAKDYVIIDLVDESQVSVYNISGQLVHAFEANTQSIVNTKDWTKGIYFINIQSNNGNIQQKIVVE